MSTLHMKVGDNIGPILLDIANEAIRKGDPEKAIRTYVQSFHGFTSEHALACLKNEYAIVVDEDGDSISLSNDKDVLAQNSSNIVDWYAWVGSRVNDIDETYKSILFYKGEIEKIVSGDCNDFNLSEMIHNQNTTTAVAVGNIAAKIIAGNEFSDKYSNGENLWEMLIEDVETGKAEKYEIVLDALVRYVFLIKTIVKDYVVLATTYDFLKKNNMFGPYITDYPFIENTFESILKIVCEFCDPTKGYYHPLLNEQIHELKEHLDDEILKTTYGTEYRRYGILQKNPKDSYDAAWISPEGEFYATVGEYGHMLHMNLAEQLFDKKLSYEDLNVEKYEEDTYLSGNGWMKVHGNEAYIWLGYSKENDDRMYVPTQKQIDALCTYMDSNHNGKFYTEFSGGFSRVLHPDPLSTSAIRQMDEIALHNAFSNY